MNVNPRELYAAILAELPETDDNPQVQVALGASRDSLLEMLSRLTNESKAVVRHKSFVKAQKKAELLLKKQRIAAAKTVTTGAGAS